MFDKLQTEISLLKNKTYTYNYPQSRTPISYVEGIPEFPNPTPSENLLTEAYIIKWLDSKTFGDIDTNTHTVHEQFKKDVLLATNTYFILLFHILKLIDKAEIKDKDYYIELLQDLSNDSIRLLLALDIYIRNSYENIDTGNSAHYKVLVEKYHIFNNLKSYMANHRLGDPTEFYRELIPFYAASAFEKPQSPAA